MPFYGPKGSVIERIHFVYLPTYLPEYIKARADTFGATVSAVMLQTRTRSYVLPLDSTLGKIARAKIATAFERGDYAMCQSRNNELIKSYKQRQGLARAGPSSELERFSEREICAVLNLNAEDIDIDDSIFSMGVTSSRSY